MTDLKHISLFQNASKEFFDSCARLAHPHSFPKGKILFIHNDPAEYFYVINKGWVKLFCETLDGTQSTIDILSIGQIFGEDSMFEDNLYHYSAEIVEHADLIQIPISILRQEIENNSKMALSMLEFVSRQRRQKEKEIEHRVIQNAPQRIGCFLLRLIKNNTPQGQTVTIHLPYDKTLIASRLGMQPETFSRALSKLKQHTGIRIKGAMVELDDLRQLIDYSCIACSSERSCKSSKEC